MKDLYNTNKDFKDYVDRYCKNKPFGVNEALRHIHIKLVGQYYKELEKNRDEAKRISKGE